MGILMGVLGILAARFGWNLWITVTIGFIPVFVVGNMIGELTFGLHCWLTDRRSPPSK